MNKILEIDTIVKLITDFYHQHQRVPLRMELHHMGVTHYKVQKLGYENLLRAAGHEPMDHGESLKAGKHKKVTNDVFAKSIDRVLDNFVHAPFHSPRCSTDILVAGDIHFPFAHHPTLEEFYDYNRRFKPKYVVQSGDLYDMYAWSKYPRSLNLYTPREEQRLAREGAEEFWKQISIDNPEAIKYQLLGNHDIRPVKRVIEKAPEMEDFVDGFMKDLYTFEGVNLVYDSREILFIDGIGFHHGYLGRLGDHRDVNLYNMVVAHTHRGGVSYKRLRNETVWELNVGFMGDPESKVLTYTPSRLGQYTLGFGHIDRYGPRFIHR